MGKKHISNITTRKNISRWVHYCKKYNLTKMNTALCGKTSKGHIYNTNIFSQVTCPRCLKELKTSGKI